MLFSPSGDEITAIPVRRRPQFQQWCQRLGAPAYYAAVAEINRLITAEGRAFVSSTMPGNKWNGTPLEPLWDACGRSREQAGFFFGLLVWEALIGRPERWIFVKAGEDDAVLGMKYFQPEDPA